MSYDMNNIIGMSPNVTFSHFSMRSQLGLYKIRRGGGGARVYLEASAIWIRPCDDFMDSGLLNGVLF